MNRSFMGLDVSFKHHPPLDAGFLPLDKLLSAYAEKAENGDGVVVAVERANGVNRIAYNVENAENLTDLDKYMAWRVLTGMLWIYGGCKVYVAGSGALAGYIESLGSGKMAFDFVFMANVFESEFKVMPVAFEDLPEGKDSGGGKIGGGLDGCRLGFDAGGSDIKVSAVVDGVPVFSEEIVWHPKLNKDPGYHFGHIVGAMKLAASKMPRVDSIGVSSAGIYIDNRTMAASLFLKVPKHKFDEHVKDIYPRAAAEIGNVPLVVANDGDVTALAGAMEYGEGRVLGIAMGTSEAGGYINESGGITGWLNELAFVPIDASPEACYDEWSRDTGRGVKYFSQDAVIKLAPAAGIELDESLSPAEKLKAVQDLMKDGDTRARDIFISIGIYLGYTLAYYSRFYDIKHLLLLGRVMSGGGGALILENAEMVLRDEYCALSEKITLRLPDERNRRVGQSVAAASMV
ncbi:MAG: ROK family protein [Defluviitaleaceae bacterium]|nr:ROK family protein [Defluviitaleaceae bacterium]MCL2835492.1 ROK family protein [Defluviitaleaceae bacterium]